MRTAITSSTHFIVHKSQALSKLHMLNLLQQQSTPGMWTAAFSTDTNNKII